VERRDGISQQVVDELVDVFAEKRLPDFGYKYLQLDAGYCGGGGGPRSFLEWNESKFPGGAEDAMKKIRSAGMKPGIWVHRVYRSYVDKYLPEIAKQHPDWFVRKADGTIYQGSYGIWTLNTANKEAVDNMVRPLFRELKRQRWDYVKIDGAGDMLYSDKQQPAAEHFKKAGIMPEESLRKWDRVARDELGRDIFILTCWGVGPGRVSVGLVDGVRLGSDGFQWNTMLGQSMMNGVAWRGDPDREYVVFEFWTQKFLGKSKGSFTAPSMDENTGMQVFAIREAREHPWVLSTTRHISQGGVSLLDEQWDADAKTLSGKSKVVIGDPYVLTVHLPEGFRLKSADVDGQAPQIADKGGTATVRIVPSATKELDWTMTFAE